MMIEVMGCVLVASLPQADIFADGVRSQKTGHSEMENPYPACQQPDHETWWSGWKYGEMVTPPGPIDAAIAKAKADYIAQHRSK